MEDATQPNQPSSPPSPPEATAAPSPKPGKTEIPDHLKEICECFGEEVIGMTLASGLSPRAKDLQAVSATDETVAYASTWLTKRGRSRRWRERITLLLEIVVVLLIGWEIHLAYQQEQHQSQNFKEQQQALTKNFNEQQQVLTTLQKSSETTANNLTALHTAIESTNTILQMQLDALKKSAAETARTAKAGEASASTASQALHVSERAYVHMTASLPKPPAAGERVHPIVTIVNVGRTPAIDVAALFFFSIVPASTPIKTAREIASSSYPQRERQSVFTLPAGQTSTMQTDSQSPYLQSMVDQLTNGETVLYVFATASYKDVFNQPHHTEICGFYQPKLNILGACAEFNKSD